MDRLMMRKPPAGTWTSSGSSTGRLRHKSFLRTLQGINPSLYVLDIHAESVGANTIKPLIRDKLVEIVAIGRHRFVCLTPKGRRASCD